MTQSLLHYVPLTVHKNYFFAVFELVRFPLLQQHSIVKLQFSHFNKMV